MESSPYFLSFMNDALNRFAHDGRIAEIHGYTAPLPPGAPECFLRRGADCWGWATWERGWRLFNPDAAALLAELKRRGETRLFDLDGAFPFCRMLADQAAGKLDSWAIRWQASVFLAGKYMLQSGRPLIRNIGGDGSGPPLRGRSRRGVQVVGAPGRHSGRAGAGEGSRAAGVPRFARQLADSAVPADCGETAL